MVIAYGVVGLRPNENIAEIILDPEMRQIIGLTLYHRLRFKCKRCATFCCKLGGPKLSEKDIEQIRRGGYSVEEFLESASNSLKSGEDGSCIFLKFAAEKNVYTCKIYDFRPALCRLYPFELDRKSPYAFTLKLIPCCMGLNNPNGETVDKEFIARYLLDAALEVLESFKN
jgi:Fe-S-cluster containining protein